MAENNNNKEKDKFHKDRHKERGGDGEKDKDREEVRLGDMLKGVISDFSVPKDIFHNLMQGAKSTKEEFLSSVKNGVTDYLNQLDFRKELSKIVDNYDFEISAKISLKKKDKDKDKDKDKN